MKSVIVINTHSFVDLITNSSSELFVCNTKKTTDMVRDLLQKLLNAHGELQGNFDRYQFSSVFGTIEEAPYIFDLDKFDETVVESYKLYQRAGDSSHRFGPGQSRPSSFVEAIAAEEDIQRTHPYYTNPINRKPWDKRTVTEAAQMDTWGKDCRLQESIIWTKFGAEKLETEMQLFVNFLQVNNFPLVDIASVQALIPGVVADYIKNNYGKWGGVDNLFRDVGFPAHLQPVGERFNEYESWGIRVASGNILIYSADDNSVPYELFDLINLYLTSTRYHIG